MRDRAVGHTRGRGQFARGTGLVCLLGYAVLAGALGGVAGLHAEGQSEGQRSVLAPGLGRLEGTDTDNGVGYVRIFLNGVLVRPTGPGEALPPVLTAQCTRQPSGKLRFELFADFGGIEDHAYHRPWMPQDGGLFPPQPGKGVVTMEFLGYTHVKPVKRQWDRLDRPSGELRYSSPAVGSSNMEEISFYLQYLKALPTLRLTLDNKTAEFHTSRLFELLRAEPLCRASGL